MCNRHKIIVDSCAFRDDNTYVRTDSVSNSGKRQPPLQEPVNGGPGKVISNLIETLGITIPDFAKVIGANENSVRAWIKGTSVPGHKFLHRIIDRFGVKPEKFFKGPAS